MCVNEIAFNLQGKINGPMKLKNVWQQTVGAERE